jgi:radical SAM protein with 4Fe4S-binding SPASM domain
VVELTERCNNSCIHCCINRPEEDASARKLELKADELKGILQQASRLGYLSVHFTGGEPLLRPDFQELYGFVRRLGMRVLLFTNARLITPELADLFSKIPPLEPIEVTVYGIHQESHEAATRMTDSYRQFRRGVNLLITRHVPFIVKSALLPCNRGEMQEFDAWAAGIPWMEEPPEYATFFDVRHRRDNPLKNREIELLRISPEEGIAVLSRDRKRYRRHMALFAKTLMRPTGSRLFACGAGTGGSICVDAYGRLQPCQDLRAPELAYDLKRGTLKEAIECFFTKLKSVQATNPDYLRRCAKCFLKNLCDVCPAKSWAETGTLDSPVEYFCEIAHAQARDMGWLKHREMAWEVEDYQKRLQG